MPYIKKDSRKEYDPLIDELAILLDNLPNDTLSGHLNYIFFRLAGTLCTPNEPESCSYARMATVSSALGEARAEFRRRVLVPYEDQKIKENGDVEL